jgi:2Fe-2S ferredoxin
MARVTFETLDGYKKTVPALEGGALVDLCDEIAAPIPFSCRSANCGTCRIVILEGASELLPPEDEELDVIDIFGGTATGDTPQRLACCARLKRGEALIRLRPVRDDE